MALRPTPTRAGATRALDKLLDCDPVNQLDEALAAYIEANPLLRRGAFTFLAAPPNLTDADLALVLAEMRAYVASVYPQLRALGVLGVSLAPTHRPTRERGCVDVAVMRDPNTAVPMGWACEPGLRIANLAKERAAAVGSESPFYISLGVPGVVAPDVVIRLACAQAGLRTHVYTGDFVETDTGNSVYLFLPVAKPR